VPYKYLEVDTLENGEYIHEVLIKKTNRRTCTLLAVESYSLYLVPNIFVNGVNTGGFDGA
jgi:hypothetical protein